MSVHMHIIKSPIARPEMLKLGAFHKEIEGYMDDGFELVEFEAFKSLDFCLLYVATGGSESAFQSLFSELSASPVYILTSGDSNSLAASMEILSYLKSNGKAGEILHGAPKAIAERIIALKKAITAQKKLYGTKAGLIGKPSDWLIASSYCKDKISGKLGIELIDVEMGEFLSEISKAEYLSNEWTDKLFHIGYDRQEIEKALNVYGALCRLKEKYDLSAMTVRCFDLLTAVRTTGCLGLAILNAEGIIAGCEGDVPSLISMCIMGEVTGKPVFMCNPSRIDLENSEMVLAHCTLPLNMPYDMSLTTHYESGIGVAVAGNIPEGECTIFKTSGDLSRHFIMAGKIKSNLREHTLCRTQIKLELPDYSYFTSDPINNHHLVCTGDETAALNAFFELL